MSFGTSGAAREATPCTLRYELEAIGRRTAGGVFDGARVADAAPRVEGSTVRFARPTFVERYELRRDGVEQSFVFDALPEGDGDLVVRGRLQTDLDASAAGDDVPELRLARANGAGISVGRVTGIDARGARARGAMRYEDGRLDLILPASFVREAALPLVLDPLIGATITVPTPVPMTGGVDAAYDANTGLLLIVWDHSNFISPSGVPRGVVLGQRVAPDGTFVGPRIPIDETTIPHSTIADVRVVPAGSRPGFVVAYELVPDLSFGGPASVGYVDARTGSVSARLTPGGNLLDIGAAASGDTAIVVRTFLPPGGPDFLLAATRLSIDASGALAVTGERALASGPRGTFSGGSISTTAGPEDRHLVVWDEQRGAEQNLFAAFLDSDLDLLDSGAIGLSSTSKHAPAVDGDGTKWCVAYQTAGTAPSIGCFGVFWDPGSASAYVTGDVSVATQGFRPDVAWLGESHMISYWGGASSVDPFTCLPCEGALALPFPMREQRVVSPKSSSPSSGDVGMIVSGSNATFFRADDGLITDLGGGCARGGRAAATCARAGNTNFALRVRGALPFGPAALILSSASADLSCGPCTLVPDPASGLAIGEIQ